MSHKNLKYIFCDYSNFKVLKKKLNQQYQYVINLGGYIDHSKFFFKGRKIINTHFFSTINLISILKKKKLKRYVHIGTCDEYGDNISPIKIENELVNSELIDQAIVYGDNKPFLVALLVLNNEKNLIEDNEIQNEIEKINLNLTKIEKIKKFFVIKEKFSIENGMLTPTLKLKRYKIIQKYKTEFERNY